ncbi:FGGY family carbohydrate kinase [Paramicrobacterium agarici]|uniref:ATP:glycerol 3-phosphotransferase n=1 Tax=Paramicrobacterium agarici TaxID=630514 RepID=A0A2A9DYX6_9MICO|nr:FGGY family carbohydrate kinase [Microbacterium agarici]PFG31182.1 glycerol kinase [Microbacterium agarici]
MGVLIGIDHGGSTTTAVVVSSDGLLLGRASVSTERHTPHPGWVEHSPESFVDGSLAAASRALSSAGLQWSDVAAFGIANQGETSIAWDEATGRPVGPALSWQDKRTSNRCAELRDRGLSSTVERISGLSIDPYFAATKYSWLSKSSDEARASRVRGTLRVGGTDSFLIRCLTGGVHATDPSTVSRTALMDLDSATWSSELAGLFDVPRSALPEIRPTVGDFGEIAHEDVPVSRLPITASIVDTNASQFLHELWSPTVVKATLGTGAFIETSAGNSPVRPSNGLAPFIGWRIGDDLRYVLEGSVYDVGAAVDWAVDIGLAESAATTSDLAASVDDTAGVILVPAFSGLAAPHWDSEARATICGLSLKANKAHLARALLEGIGLAITEAILLLADTAGHDDPEVAVDGGPSRNKFLMQLLADLLGYPVRAVQEPDITGFGAACLAGLGKGIFTQADLANLRPDSITYSPMTNTAFREDKRRLWRDAVDWVRKEERFRD